MKNIFNIALILLASTTVMAKNFSKEVALFKATLFEKQFAQAKTFEGLSRMLFLTDADKKLFIEDLKKNKQLKLQLPSSISNGTLITLGNGNSQLKIDFKDISDKVLYLNDHKVEIKKYRTYVRSLVLIRDILKTTSKNAVLNFFINEAYAGDTSAFDYLYAALFSSQSNLEELTVPHAALAETISQTYEKYIYAESNGKPEFYKDDEFCESHNLCPHTLSLLSFTCKDGRLDKVMPQVVVSNGKPKKFTGNDSYFTYHPKDNSFEARLSEVGYVYQWDKKQDFKMKRVFYNCDISGQLDGRITKSNRAIKFYEMAEFPSKHDPECPAENSNIFDAKVCDTDINEKDEKIEPTVLASCTAMFGHFPEIADACCQETGCAEKVNSTIEKATEAYVERVKKEDKSGSSVR